MEKIIMAIVYVTTNLINGKKYLGKRVHDNPEYLGSGIALKLAIQKYGKQNFTKKIIAYFKTIQEASLEEKRLSLLWDVVNSKEWYNLIPGGTGGSRRGRKISETTRKKISMAKKGCSAWNRGLGGTEIVKHKEETKRKISLANKGQKNPSGGNHPSSKKVIFIDMEGKLYYTKGIREFCRNNNISYSTIAQRLRHNSNLPEKNGWKVKYAK